jgi:hypothetical protein
MHFEYLLTYLLTELSPLGKPSIMQSLRNFPAFYGTRRFIAVFTRALQWSLSWARLTQSTPSHPISQRSFLILSTHLRLGLPSGLLPSGFPTKYPIFIPRLPHACYMPCPSHPHWLDHSNYVFLITCVFGSLITLIMSSDYFSSINLFVFLMEPECVFCAAGNKFVNYALINLRRRWSLIWWSEGSEGRETVKYGHESYGTRNQESRYWRGPSVNSGVNGLKRVMLFICLISHKIKSYCQELFVPMDQCAWFISKGIDTLPYQLFCSGIYFDFPPLVM